MMTFKNLAFTITIFLSTCSINQVFAQMEILLWPEGAPDALDTTASDKPSLFIYQAPKETATGAAVLICPGGGYAHLAMDHEGHDVAKWLNSMGISAFVLKYRLGSNEYRHPTMLNDAKRAMRMIRSDAKKYGIHEESIGVLGFSAGGHLASTLGTHYDDGMPDSNNKLDATSTRPDFMVLLYPVIMLNSKYTHRGSRENLLGKNPPRTLVDSLSNNTQINSMTPPTFLVHSSDDTAVPPQNSIEFYLQLREHNVPSEMHIFSYGGHGYGMAPEDPYLHSWTALCQQWLAKMGYANEK